MRMTIEATLVTLSLFTAMGTMFLLWNRAQGFIPWQGDWWVWLGRSIAYHRNLPDGMFWPGVGFCFALALVCISATLWHQRPSIRTMVGGVDPNVSHGSARWARRRDIEAAGLVTDAGVTVGAVKEKPSIKDIRIRRGSYRSRPPKPLRHNGPEHVLAFAPTRSGKGVSLVLPTLLEWQHSAVVLDIKGENYSLTAGYRKSLGHNILKFEPTALSGSVKFNPLAEIRVGTDYELMDCQNVAAMIIDPDGKGLRDFWMQSGFEWLSAAILHVLYRMLLEEKRTATLADVNRILSAVEFDQSSNRLETLLEFMIAYKHGRDSVNAEVSRVAAKMVGRADQERSGVHSSSLTQLSLYADPIIARNIGASDFRLDDLMNGDRPAALYIVIPPSDLDRLRPLIRVIFNIMLRRLTAGMEFENGRSVGAYKHKLLLMLDEFTSVGKLEIFDKALPFMAGYGLKCFIIVQDLTQLQKAYGREESILSNCHVRIAFAPNKIETAKTLSDMLGKQTVIQAKRTRSGGTVSARVSDTLAGASRPLMTPEEVMAMPGARKNSAGEVEMPGEMLILAAGFPAIRGVQRLYFKDETLMERARIPAPCRKAKREAPAPKPGYRAQLDEKIRNPSTLANPEPNRIEDHGGPS